MESQNGNNQFDAIAIFNTILGLVNMEKNTMSQIHSDKLEKKLDHIIEGMGRIETMLKEGKVKQIDSGNIYD